MVFKRKVSIYSRLKKKRNSRFLWEVLKAVGIIVLAVGGVYIYKHERFYDSKLETYVQLTEVTGELSNQNEDSIQFSKLRRDFYVLYFGKSQLFEGKGGAVKEEIFNFKKTLEEVEKVGVFEKYSFSSLQLAALHLANACADELQ